MKIKLTLQEKLRDLGDGRKMILSDLEGLTGTPLSTLQRMEGKEIIRADYQDVAMLAQSYGVLTDYLFGLADNRLVSERRRTGFCPPHAVSVDLHRPKIDFTDQPSERCVSF